MCYFVNVLTHLLFSPPLPPSKPIHWGSWKIPRGWFPVDQKAEYELVPLDPESSSYHFVASAFVSEKLPDWKILDIYRLQNPFLWHKFKRYIYSYNEERKIHTQKSKE